MSYSPAIKSMNDNQLTQCAQRMEKVDARDLVSQRFFEGAAIYVNYKILPFCLRESDLI